MVEPPPSMDRRVRRDHRRRYHKALLRVVSHTPVEVEKLNLVRAAGAWVDALRHFVPGEEKLYTWWSYRARDWDPIRHLIQERELVREFRIDRRVGLVAAGRHIEGACSLKKRATRYRSANGPNWCSRWQG
jgi:hypothetical protein